jgi:hypothetical protein
MVFPHPLFRGCTTPARHASPTVPSSSVARTPILTSSVSFRPVICAFVPDFFGTVNEQYPTEWRVERFFPDYYSKPRPEPVGLPANLTYGGQYFDITLPSSSLGSDAQSSLDATKVVVMRFGFSTHGIVRSPSSTVNKRTSLTFPASQNFGQKYLQLNSTYSFDNGTATIHTSQLPPNPAIIAPGPAYIFVVVNGVPSIGQPVMVGSGVIEKQNVSTAVELPAVHFSQPATTTAKGSSAIALVPGVFGTVLIAVAAVLFTM